MDRLNPLPKGRAQLSQVLQTAGELISVEDVTTALQIDKRQATKLLARWNAQGWINRLRRGIYAPVALASIGQRQVLDDPWVIVPTLFGRGYIGGWTAAEHCRKRLHPRLAARWHLPRSAPGCCVGFQRRHLSQEVLFRDVSVLKEHPAHA